MARTGPRTTNNGAIYGRISERVSRSKKGEFISILNTKLDWPERRTWSHVTPGEGLANRDGLLSTENKAAVENSLYCLSSLSLNTHAAHNVIMFESIKQINTSMLLL